MSYPSDLTPQEFALIEKFLPKKKITRPRKYSNYQLFNAILYVLISGCQWRMLPNDLPNWKTVHHYFGAQSKDKIFDEMLTNKPQDWRLQKGKNERRAMLPGHSKHQKYRLAGQKIDRF